MTQNEQVVVEQIDRDEAATIYGRFRDHDMAGWCRPVENDEGVWIHNSMDRREHTIEKGRVQ